MYFSEGGFVDTPTYDRARLAPGQLLSGPAVVEQTDSTTVIHPGYTGVVDLHGNILIGRPARIAEIRERAPVTAPHGEGERGR